MTILDEPDKKKYVALMPLKLQNPGGKPSSIRIEVDEVVTFDGIEGVHLDQLIQGGAVKPYRKPAPRTKKESK